MSLILLNSYPQPPVATVLFSDTFTGTDGAGWNAAKWDSQLNSTLLSNQGKLVGTGGAYFVGSARALMTPTADMDFVGNFQLSDTSNEAYLYIWMRVATTGTLFSPLSGYSVTVRAAENVIGIYKYPGGVQATMVTAAWTRTTAKSWIRVQTLGTEIRARIWLDGSTEPLTWDINGFDSTFTSGVVGVAHSNGASGVARSVLIDDVTVTAL